MASSKRPALRKHDRVTLSRIKRPIPAHDGKPFVGREDVLTVSHITGTGAKRNPWGVVVTDGTHFWHLEPDDVTPVEADVTTSHSAKKVIDNMLKSDPNAPPAAGYTKFHVRPNSYPISFRKENHGQYQIFRRPSDFLVKYATAINKISQISPIEAIGRYPSVDKMLEAVERHNARIRAAQPLVCTGCGQPAHASETDDAGYHPRCVPAAHSTKKHLDDWLDNHGYRHSHTRSRKALQPYTITSRVDSANKSSNRHAKSLKSIEPGLRGLAQRSVNAENSFIAYAMEHGRLSRDQAATALATFRKARVIRLDAVNGSFHVKHGQFLEPDVLRRAAGLLDSR
jgi:hypothetical protein